MGNAVSTAFEAMSHAFLEPRARAPAARNVQKRTLAWSEFCLSAAGLQRRPSERTLSEAGRIMPCMEQQEKR